jgi:hypothetical protein
MAAAGFFGGRDEQGQVIPDGGLPAAELHERFARYREGLQAAFQCFERNILPFASLGEAEGTFQVAALVTSRTVQQVSCCGRGRARRRGGTVRFPLP